MSVKLFGEADENTLTQMENCMKYGDYGVLSADNHLGYNHPIGGAVASEEFISVSGVGFDIGCGNKAVATNLFYSDIRGDLERIMDEIFSKVAFGVGRKVEKRIDHPVFDEINQADFAPVKTLLGKAQSQLGTVGAGNHYVDLFREQGTDRVWIGVHFGSRGFGHTVASGFMSMARGTGTFLNPGKAEGGMMDDPIVLHVDSSLGHAYLECMNLAGQYAYAGRDVGVEQVKSILGAEQFGQDIHNPHNYAWLEEHHGRFLWVVRKGCTPAFPGQQGFVGGSMGDISVILEGQDGQESVEGLYSTVHGAGRAMSRSEAAGKQRKRWRCNTRDCDWVQPPKTHKPDACPECGSTNLRKRWVQERAGRIDWQATLDDLKQKGIVLRGGAADEAPLAYKRIEEVLAAQGDTINIKKVLIPIGVAMAGPETSDPYKD